VRRLLLALVIAAPAAFSQLLSVGVKAGVPFTDAFNTGVGALSNFTSEDRRYTFGGTAELNLPFGLGVEFDALYKRLGYQETLVDSGLERSVTANAWDFPVLLKVKTGMRPLQPFFVVGPTFRGLTNLEQAGSFFSGSRSDAPEELQNEFTTGFTAGAGLRLGGRTALSPEIRYTRWGWRTFRSPAGLLESNQDQLEFLVGLTF
jgi:hypothetical protein